MQDLAGIRSALDKALIEGNSYSGEYALSFSINTTRVVLLSKSITMYKAFINQPF
jgi:hypothetical protein